MKSVSLFLNRSTFEPSGMHFLVCLRLGPSAQAFNPAAKRLFDKSGAPFTSGKKTST
jgi:hypothetical protein